MSYRPVLGTHVGAVTVKPTTIHRLCSRCGAELPGEIKRKKQVCRDCREVIRMLDSPRVMKRIMSTDLEDDSTARRGSQVA